MLGAGVGAGPEAKSLTNDPNTLFAVKLGPVSVPAGCEVGPMAPESGTDENASRAEVGAGATAAGVAENVGNAPESLPNAVAGGNGAKDADVAAAGAPKSKPPVFAPAPPKFTPVNSAAAEALGSTPALALARGLIRKRLRLASSSGLARANVAGPSCP